MKQGKSVQSIKKAIFFMQPKLITIYKILLLEEFAFLAIPGHAQDKIGVLMLHGKNPGSN